MCLRMFSAAAYRALPESAFPASKELGREPFGSACLQLQRLLAVFINRGSVLWVSLCQEPYFFGQHLWFARAHVRDDSVFRTCYCYNLGPILLQRQGGCRCRNDVPYMTFSHAARAACCKTLDPKRSVGLQHTKPPKKNNVGWKTLKGVLCCKPLGHEDMLGCKTLSLQKTSAGAEDPRP